MAGHDAMEGNYDTVSCSLQWNPSVFTATFDPSRANEVSILQHAGPDSFKDEDLNCAPLNEVNKDSEMFSVL